MSLFNNTLFLKIFSVINLLFLGVVLVLGIVHSSMSFELIVFVATLLFLIITPILYAFHIYFNVRKNIAAFFEMMFGSIFLYQVVWYIIFPFAPILLTLKNVNSLFALPFLNKMFFTVSLLVFCAASTLFTFRYFWILKKKNNFFKTKE